MTLFRVDVVRQLRDVGNIIFVLVMPTLMFVILVRRKVMGRNLRGMRMSVFTLWCRWRVMGRRCRR